MRIIQKSVAAVAVACAVLTMPVARADDLCSGAFYDSGFPDGFSALSNERSTKSGVPDGQCVDDVYFPEGLTIRTIHWYSCEKGSYAWTGAADLIVLVADGERESPGTIRVEQNDLPADRLDTGQTLFDLPLYHYTLSDLAISLEPGRFWFGMRPVQDGAGRAYWPTAPLYDYTAHWRSSFFGEPKWTPTDKSDEFRDVTDFTFCLSASNDPCTDQKRADADCSGAVDFNDLDCFVAGLIGEDAWRECVGDASCNFLCVSDVNRDGSVSFDDIDAFVACVIDGGCE